MILRIDNPEMLAKKCRRSITEATGLKNLGFNLQRDEFGRRETWRLVGPWASTGFTDKQSHTVIQLIKTRRTFYWLSSSLNLVFDSGEYLVEGISLSVFRGGLRDEAKEVIFRAEWASYDDNSEVEHAQPHWHIYQNNTRTAKGDTDAGFSIEQPLAEFSAEQALERGKSQWVGAHKFHYAMASSWHKDGSDAHTLDLNDEDQALNWIEGCLRYIINQIKYIDK